MHIRLLSAVVLLAFILTCTGCVATQAVLDMGLYNDHYYLTNLYEDNNGDLYFQIHHSRKHFGDNEREETDNFLIKTTKEDLVARAYDEGNTGAYKDDKGRNYFIHATYCGQDFGTHWEKSGETFINPDDGLTLASDLSSVQLHEKNFQLAIKTSKLRKNYDELTNEEYDSLVKVMYDDEPHAALVKCRDTFMKGKKQPEYLASRVLVLPPAVVFDIVTFPIQAIIIYKHIEKIH